MRTRAEYAAGHLAGSTNIDFYSSDFRDRLAGLDKDRTYLVYCQTENRSAQATAVMHAMGFKHVYDVQGGIAAWQQTGLPTTQIGVAAAGRPATGQMVSETVNKLCGRRSTRGPGVPLVERARAGRRPARYTVYRCGMSTERIQDWFATLPPQARVDWLETGQTAVGLTAVLLRTLPEEHRPGHADAWVFGPVYPKWLLAAADSPAYVLSGQFGEFLAAEYSRWYGGEQRGRR